MLPEKPKKDLKPENSGEEYVTYTPKIKDSRLLIQSGVFIHALKGYINLKKNNIIRIEAKSKQDILGYLSKFCNISHKTLFNDLHGFIRSQKNRLKATRHFAIGLSYHDKGDYSQAITSYDKAIELDPKYTEVYRHRALASTERKNYD